MQHHIGSAADLCHLIDERETGGVAVAQIGVDLPHFTVLSLIHLIHRLGRRPHISSLNQPRIETLGKKDDLLAARKNAESARQRA